MFGAKSCPEALQWPKPLPGPRTRPLPGGAVQTGLLIKRILNNVLGRSEPQPAFPIQESVRSAQIHARSGAAPLLNYPPAMRHRF